GPHRARVDPPWRLTGRPGGLWHGLGRRPYRVIVARTLLTKAVVDGPVRPSPRRTARVPRVRHGARGFRRVLGEDARGGPRARSGRPLRAGRHGAVHGAGVRRDVRRVRRAPGQGLAYGARRGRGAAAAGGAVHRLRRGPRAAPR